MTYDQLKVAILLGIFDLALIWIAHLLYKIYVEVKKGNKDQQEIKTRLTWLKKWIKSILD